ncbi:MAG: hypothetical protein ACR2IE_13790 [Candidatus Sumerlaeaceae bacterium]
MLVESTGDAAEFIRAEPVWLSGRSTELNVFAGFRASFERDEAKQVRLRVTASSIYRALVNGKFVGHGPARAAHGFYRVDEWELDSVLRPGINVVALEVAGYNSNSYYLINQPSFVQAEIVVDGNVVAHTGGKGAAGFEGRALSERIQKVQRTSFQRPFAEAYILQPGYDQWRADPGAAFGAQPLETTSAKNLLPRGVPYPRFRRIQPVAIVSEGISSRTAMERSPFRDRSLTETGPKLVGFREDELAVVLSRDLAENMSASSTSLTQQSAATVTRPVSLATSQFVIFDFGQNLTGFGGASFECDTSTTLLFSFDELLREGSVDALRLGMVGAVRYDVGPGAYTVEFLEPHTFRYLRVLALEGTCTLREVALREYANDTAWEATFACSDERLQRIFEAGRQTFRQNSVDIFMDCPSRERAGWLCDSFFTARAAGDLTGRTDVERNFLENFALPEKFAHLPDGMLPMCYPADHNDGVYIPNWAMWFVIELEEYYKRSGDRKLLGALESRVMNLFNFLARYRNSDGLLEKLDSWVFVEWSKANEFTQDVNYPTNMLYAGALDAAGRLYGRDDLATAASAIRETIRKQSFNGKFFVDNAKRQGARLERQSNMSEVCQYFAFFFDLATPQTHAELWQTLRDKFGPGRAANGFPEVAKANAFIGNMMRIDLLGRFGETPQLPRELVFYNLAMADKSGTIWENDTDFASLNHGFGAHVVHTIYRDVLGIASVDTINKRVRLRVPANELQWCNGRMPLKDGFVDFRWRKEGGRVQTSYSAPAGYTVVTD